MKGRTFKFKTGSPVRTGKYIGFLPTVRDQEQHAEFFAAQARLAEGRDNAQIGILEALMGLAGHGGR